jgi:uncharacterized damage-inducible protein DinB
MSTISSVKISESKAGEIEMFRRSAHVVHKVVQLNSADLTQAESLIQPRPAGNCLNWVIGHLLCVYGHALPLLGQKPVIEASALQRYDRGSSPITDAAEARELSELMNAWDETAERIDAGLLSLTSETLDAPAPFSPNNDPKETVRSLLTLIFFHQAYHAGQTGLLRRIVGKEGAIA